ncbi:hypothetical protein M3936_19260 [Sutcliffiella horikoshii]|uniref:hypothetical protein n=1 Tax=Sutcliffiella horikoshii TaxID=79883 RepID=UPI00203BDFB1|nr:hypothetical protein [Sutcliffiella horikoshii]MCM3619712.1 hypothetical protein [Sutcliffiella horikoshii]
MRINFEKLQAGLKPFEVKNEERAKVEDCSGTAKAIHYIWTHTPTKEIDFDSFSVKDVRDAIDVINMLPLHWDEGGECFIADPENLLIRYDNILKVFYAMTESHKKKYKKDEEDIFI